jgi:hypothetical protein
LEGDKLQIEGTTVCKANDNSQGSAEEEPQPEAKLPSGDTDTTKGDVDEKGQKVKERAAQGENLEWDAPKRG